LELIEACGTGMLKIQEAYSGTGKTPQIETSDNTFKIILPNLNVHTKQEEPATDKLTGDIQEDLVIDLAKKQGTFMRKDLERTLGISQTTCGRLLKRMIGSGQIVQEGKGRNTHYRLSE
ncbi:MAG: AAA family ATPase, partial [Lachnospiraceae bacterium]|nr:AAA family ATPase [Lachnospiraceae bacterium]